MTPRKRAPPKRAAEGEGGDEFTGSEGGHDTADDGSDYVASDEGDEGRRPAKKKKPAAAPAGRGRGRGRGAGGSGRAGGARAGGRAVKTEEPGGAVKTEGSSGDAGGGTPKKAARSPAKKKAFEPEEGDAWSYNLEEGALLIWRDFGTEPNEKIAAFDLDQTLIFPKSSQRFPTAADDWRFYNKKVPKVLRDLHADGYKVVVFSNQGGVRSALGGKMAINLKKKLGLIQETLEVPLQVFMAPQKDAMRKPERGMWDFFTANCNGGVKPDLNSSFFVGDAAGRGGGGGGAGGEAAAAAPAVGSDVDHSDSDKMFAEAIGLPFKLPEDVFGEPDGKRPLTAGEKETAKASLEDASNPNSALFNLLADYAAACSVVHRDTGDAKFMWKGAAAKNAATSLALFQSPITLDNYKQLAKLPKVGKGTIALIKEWLETGTISCDFNGEGGGAGAGAGAGAAAQTSKRQEAALAYI